MPHSIPGLGAELVLPQQRAICLFIKSSSFNDGKLKRWRGEGPERGHDSR